MDEKTFNTGELALNYAEGAPNGTPLLLLHGSTRWWREWEPAIPMLEANWQVYALDLRGHGHSGRDGDHYRQADYTRDVEAFIRRGIDRPAVIMGYSLGAVVATMLAAQSPGRVSALVLLDPPLFMRDRARSLGGETNQWMQFLRQTLAVAPTYEAIVAAMRAMQPDTPAEKIDTFARILSLLAPETLDIALHNEMIDSAAYNDALRQIACPTLLIRADPARGGLIPDADVDFARAHIEHLAVVSVANAAHHELLEGDFAAQTLDAMQSFLRTLEQV